MSLFNFVNDAGGNFQRDIFCFLLYFLHFQCNTSREYTVCCALSKLHPEVLNCPESLFLFSSLHPQSTRLVSECLASVRVSQSIVLPALSFIFPTQDSTIRQAVKKSVANTEEVQKKTYNYSRLIHFQGEGGLWLWLGVGSQSFQLYCHIRASSGSSSNTAHCLRKRNLTSHLFSLFPAEAVDSDPSR